jgi:hypothetical protein
MVESDDVAAFSGQTRTYTRSGESGKEVHYEFCPQCGATIRWRIDIVPNRQVFAGGAFDDIREFNVVGEMYTSMALPWARLDCDLTRSGAPDDNFRASLIERTNSLRD